MAWTNYIRIFLGIATLLLQSTYSHSQPLLRESDQLDLSPSSIIQTVRNTVKLPGFLGGRTGPDSDVRFGQTRDPDDPLIDLVSRKDGTDSLRHAPPSNPPHVRLPGPLALLPALFGDLAPTRDAFKRAQDWLRAAMASGRSGPEAPVFVGNKPEPSSDTSLRANESPLLNNHRFESADVDKEENEKSENTKGDSAADIDANDKEKLDVLGALGKLMFQSSKRHP